MALKIFITGVTGYIAGDAFHALYEAHPDYEYSLLVRTKEKAQKVTDAYPSVRIVLGGLDDSSLLEDEASKANIVLHAADASDHEGAAKAIAAGIVRGHSKENPGYWLHTGGSGILCYDDSKNDFQGLGRWSDKQYNDLDGVDELTTLPDEAFHRNVDKIVLETGTKYADSVKTVILCPPTIYGKGRGQLNQRGRQVYELSKLILQKQFIPVIGDGKSRWNYTHVADLSQVFCALVDRAAAKDTSDELWGAKGYMFIEQGEHVWSELAKAMATKAHEMKLISKPEPHQLGKNEATDVAGFEAVSWGLNSRGKAGRAAKFLGWRPSRGSIWDEIPQLLEQEHERSKTDQK